ncbi:MAG: GAF domain-containing protein [Deltaproteobacteria bacterium]|nr:GAF domain-containing protein [Deltaproteobacteria bacterium]MBW2536921.1 GAF domain-containing protein [Deltaproteobacteria bacterium]
MASSTQVTTSSGEAAGDRAVPAETLRLLRVLDELRADGRFADHLVAHNHPLLITVRSERRVVLIAPAAAWQHGQEVFRPFAQQISQALALAVLLGCPATSSLETAVDRGVFAVLSEEPSADDLYVAVRGAFELIEARQRSENRGRWLNRYRYELGELVEISQALTTERDIDKLLALILEKSRFITGADAGSIYVVEGDDPDMARRSLRFKLSQNDSVRFDSSEFTMPINPRSMAGYVALHRTTINIPDVYELPADSPYAFQRSYDQASGYRSMSMLCTPLTSHHDEVIGVIQLINKKREPEQKLLTPDDALDLVIPFDERSHELLTTLASQAGIALDNAILYRENQRMLEGFVQASVEAIEQRDPTTSGHSRRVADMTVELAKAVERCDAGPYQSVTWSPDDLKELEYASLLHDFGKIGVREQVLVKAKKLYPEQLEVIRSRFGLAVRAAEVDVLTRKVRALRRGASDADLEALDLEGAQRRAELEAALELVAQANEPMIVSGGDFERIEALARETFVDAVGRVRTLLDDEDIVALSIPRGSLTPAEYDEIRSHVEHTFEFLSQIPWGRKFRRVAQIAGAHHERLDGTGYPHRLHGSEIPLQSKLMSIADIFDALTAADRPYKKAVPLGRALAILKMEVDDHHIDGELVQVFVDARVWHTLPDPPTD